MDYFKKDGMRIMPVMFGPGGTPRETADGNRYVYKNSKGTTINSYKIIYEVDAITLKKMLPKFFTLSQPYIILSFNQLRNIGWLAGNGYDLIQIEIPAVFNGCNGEISGTFVPVVWENHADPILTGREQLGWNKIYADMNTPTVNGGIVRGSAYSWGFKFFELELNLNQQPPNPEEFMRVINSKENKGMMHLKYMPRTGGNFDIADIEYITLSPKVWDAPKDVNLDMIPKAETHVCSGKVTWYRAVWNQMPTQFHIVQKLYDLNVKRYIGACNTISHSLNDRKDQRIIK